MFCHVPSISVVFFDQKCVYPRNRRQFCQALADHGAARVMGALIRPTSTKGSNTIRVDPMIAVQMNTYFLRVSFEQSQYVTL